MALLEAPLAFVTKIEKFKIFNFIGIAGIITFIVTLVIFFVTALADSDPGNNPVGGMLLFPEDWFEAASSVPNMILSLEFHFNMYPIYKGMKDPSDKKMANATFMGVFFCFLIYLLTGFIGYDYAGPGTQTNFLESISYEKTSKVFFFILNVSFLVSVFFSFPLLFFSSRDNMIAVGNIIVQKKAGSQKQPERDDI